MAIRTKDELDQLQHHFLSGELMGLQPAEDDSTPVSPAGVGAKKALVASFFKRSEVELLLNKLSEMDDPNEYVKVFMVTKEDGGFSMAMCGADKYGEKPTPGIFPAFSSLEVAGAAVEGAASFDGGLIAEIDCPPHCQEDRNDGSGNHNSKENDLFVIMIPR